KGREAERQKALRSLEEISPRDLSNEQQLDRLALRAHLLKESEDYLRRRHELEPNAPEQVLNVLLHELMRGDDEPVRAARNLRSLLKQAPAFLEKASALPETPERVWTNIMDQTVAGAPLLLEGVTKFLEANAGNGKAASGKEYSVSSVRHSEMNQRRPAWGKPGSTVQKTGGKDEKA